MIRHFFPIYTNKVIIVSFKCLLPENPYWHLKIPTNTQVKAKNVGISIQGIYPNGTGLVAALVQLDINATNYH